MKRLLASVIAAGIATAVLSTVSFAGPNANANIQLHMLGVTSKNPCTRQGATPATQTMPICRNAIDEAPANGTYHYLHVIVTNGNATAGVAGAVRYPVRLDPGRPPRYRRVRLDALRYP